jgi:hypothetical protein
MRLGWILLMAAGVVVFGAFAVIMPFGVQIGDVVIRSRGIWPILSLMAAGICAAGIFMKPAEFRTLAEPPPIKKAAWLEEMQAQEGAFDNKIDQR